MRGRSNQFPGMRHSVLTGAFNPLVDLFASIAAGG